MEFQLLDVVITTDAIPDSGIYPGMTGTVVEVYSDGVVEVEFCNDDGETTAMVPMLPSQLRITKHDEPR